jgi:hypothetical protein
MVFYNYTSLTNGANATSVFGQSDFVSNNQAVALSQNRLDNPTGIFSDGVRLFIADYNQERVVVVSEP